MNFIIRISCSVKTLETTCWLEVAKFGNYEIHSFEIPLNIQDFKQKVDSVLRNNEILSVVNF